MNGAYSNVHVDGSISTQSSLNGELSFLHKRVSSTTKKVYTYLWLSSKSSLYINVNEDKIFLSSNKKNTWIFEKHNYNDNYLYMKRYIKNKKFYYINLKDNETFTNFYLGWSNENIIF